MFTSLSAESVFDAPRRIGMYVSCTVHVVVLIALTWFSFFNVSKVRFQIMTVQAGSEEPVRSPERLYFPASPAAHSVSDHSHVASPRPPAVSHTPGPVASAGEGDFTPKTIPADFVALLHTKATEPVSVTATAGTGSVTALMPPEPPLSMPEPPPGQPDVKPPAVITSRLEPAELIKQKQPQYPPMARAARVQGVVVLAGTVNVSGSIEDIRVVEGHPLLVDEARNTIKKWKYRPAILNGHPVPSPVTITVRFTLKYPD
jgi:TonB family protein